MMDEILAADPASTITCLGVNGIGQESGNAAVCAGRDLPWLQDLAAVNAWTSWAVAYRDVFVLDDENRVFAVYNLTSRDLANAANYSELKSLLLAANAP